MAEAEDSLTEAINVMLLDVSLRPDWDGLEIYSRQNYVIGGSEFAIVGYDLVGDRYVFPFRLPSWFYRLSRTELVTRIINFIANQIESLPRNLSPSA